MRKHHLLPENCTKVHEAEENELGQKQQVWKKLKNIDPNLTCVDITGIDEGKLMQLNVLTE